MAGLTEDQRLTLASLHALAQATLRGKESESFRRYLTELADYAPDREVLVDSDPRSDAALGKDVEPSAARRRFAARLRGVVLGAGAHADTARRELVVLAKTAVGGEGVSDKELEERSLRALEVTRKDLESDIVRLGDVELPPEHTTDFEWVRRWGIVRLLELNAFTASFTRDGTHPGATRATSEGLDASALRFSLAVAQAAMSLPHETPPTALLARDARTVENAVQALLANVIVTGR